MWPGCGWRRLGGVGRGWGCRRKAPAGIPVEGDVHGLQLWCAGAQGVVVVQEVACGGGDAGEGG